MSIPDEKILEFRKALDESAKPLFFFDGDVDGLASFTLLYQRKREGRMVMVGGRPQLGEEFARKVDEFQPDTVFILDLAMVTQEFIDAVKTPIYWLDHHEPRHDDLRLPKRVKYYNPRLWDDSDGRPTSYWAYLISEGSIWMAMAGIIGDYHWDAELADRLRESFPDLLPRKIEHQGAALFDSKLGQLIKVLNFNLKGPVSSALTSVKIVTRIEHPDEILLQESARGKFLHKRFLRVMGEYENLLQAAESQISVDEKFLVFIYEHDRFSISGDLANELKFRHPEKIVIVGRRHDGKAIMSLRSETVVIHDNLKRALEGLEGYGGGHPLACGAVVRDDQFDEFLEKFKSLF